MNTQTFMLADYHDSDFWDKKSKDDGGIILLCIIAAIVAGLFGKPRVKRNKG